MHKHILLAVSITILLLGMSIIPSVAVDTVNIDHSKGKSSSDDTDWWPMFRHDLQHSGYSTSDAPDTNNVLWTYSTDGDVYTSPAVVDGRVYSASDYIPSGDDVYCLYADTGDFIWSYPTGDWVYSSPAVADGKVYIGSYNHNVYCLYADTGDFIWSYPTGSWLRSSPSVADGKVYIGSETGVVYAFGELNPEAPSTPEINGPRIGASGILYNFTFKAESPLGKDLYYWVEWADGSNSGWLGPYGSGVEITESHVWDAKGKYPIQAKAKDTNGSVSSWGICKLRILRTRATTSLWYQWFFERFPLLERLLRLYK